MENRRSFAIGAIALLVVGLFISNSFAGLVDSGSETLSDSYYHVSSDTTFSFAIQVDYEVHDIGGDLYEARFQMEHLGEAAAGDTSMDIGRFMVYSGDYVAVGSTSGAGLVAPSYIEPVGAYGDRAVYYFDTDFPNYVPTFSHEDVSELLTLTFNAVDMPQSDIVIEADLAPYGSGGDTFITLAIPEPATLLLLGSGVMLLKRRKR